MAKNWNAYEAAKALYGTNKEEIKDICKRFPLFARLVLLENSTYLLTLLAALPKVTCRIAEQGLAGIEIDAEEAETEEQDIAEDEVAGDDFDEDEEAAEDEDVDYESMSVKNLYKLCCDRGISSRCKKRDKKSLIKVLTDYDNEQAGGEDEEDEEVNPYKGKTAKELYAMCKDRGIKAETRKKAQEYAELLMKADEEAKKKSKKSKKEEPDDDDWDDDDWEI